MISRHTKNGIGVLTMESDHLLLSVIPALGGKISGIFNKHIKKEFLWSNENIPLRINNAGDDYDSNFFGGIDELLPNDIPETIDSISYPDHGELWTCTLNEQIHQDKLLLNGKTRLSGLRYSKAIRLDTGSPAISLDYKITNESGNRKHFLWKLHAALKIAPGDRLITKALNAKVVHPEYSRFTDTKEFQWPFIQGVDASIVPPKNNTMDFFYLYDIPEAEMQLLAADGKSLFSYSYDKKIFPYQWYFASYGGFLDHYTAILEPCTTMPIRVNEAMGLKQCSVLEPGEELATTVKIFAGEIKNYKSTHG